MAAWCRPNGSRRNSWEVREGGQGRKGECELREERWGRERNEKQIVTCLGEWNIETRVHTFRGKISSPSTFCKNGDDLHLLAACETEDAPLLMLALSALWSHDTTVYSSTPTTSAPRVSWTVVGGVIQRRAGEIALLSRLSCAEQTSVRSTGEQGYCSCKQDPRLTAGHTVLEHTVYLTGGGGSTHQKTAKHTDTACIPWGIREISNIKTETELCLPNLCMRYKANQLPHIE